MQASKQQQIRLPQQPQAKLIQGQLLPQNATTLAAQVRPGGAVHHNLIQTDGVADTSSSDDDFDDDDKEDEDKEDEVEEEEQGEEEDPLNSGDDVSEEDPTELFDTENVVVCQYDKINRNKNKWKFHLKDGIMNLNGRDFVFQKATGDSEW
jgi:transcription initiation factor TFIIA large subunit